MGTMTVSGEMPDLAGHEFANGVRVISGPYWHEPSEQWRALADVHGTLCVIELSITIKGPVVTQ